jgi:hypothetical protein
MADDKMMITVLEDGTIKIETDKVSAANHVNAEAFVRDAARLAGGPTIRKMKHSHGHLGEHEHDHEHSHEHEGH